MILYLEAIWHDKWHDTIRRVGSCIKKKHTKQNEIRKNAIQLDCGEYPEEVMVTGQYIYRQKKEQILKTQYKMILKVKSTRTLKAISNEEILKEK